MTEQTTEQSTQRRTWADYITPSLMAQCRAAEDTPSDTYRTACALLAGRSRRFPDAGSVALVARILLASKVGPSEDNPRRAAGMACAAAARILASVDAQYTAHVTPSGAMAADDDTVGRSTIARTSWARPDAVASWTDLDTIGTALRSLGGVPTGHAGPMPLRAALLDALTTTDGWSEDGPSAGNVNGRALAECLTGRTSRRAAVEVRALAESVLTDVRALVPAMRAETPVGDCSASDTAPSLERDTSVPASGTASPVVTLGTLAPMLARADGLPALVKVTGEGGTLLAAGTGHHADRLRRNALTLVTALPAWNGVRNGMMAEREVTRADITANVERARTSPARRPAGVGVALVYGASASLSGEGAPDARPVPSRRRKRGGGVGGPMLTGPSSTGTGPSTAGTLDHAYGSRRCSCPVKDGGQPRAPYCAAHDVRLLPAPIAAPLGDAADWSEDDARTYVERWSTIVPTYRDGRAVSADC